MYANDDACGGKCGDECGSGAGPSRWSTTITEVVPRAGEVYSGLGLSDRQQE